MGRRRALCVSARGPGPGESRPQQLRRVPGGARIPGALIPVFGEHYPIALLPAVLGIITGGEAAGTGRVLLDTVVGAGLPLLMMFWLAETGEGQPMPLVTIPAH